MMATPQQRKITNKALMVTKRSILKCSENITEQSQAVHANINYILKNYQKNGTLEHAKEFAGKYDDVSNQDFTEAMNLVTEAQHMFNELPSSIRTETGDAAGFLEFVQNSANAEKLQKMGLIEGNDGLTAEGTPSGAPIKTESTPPCRQNGERSSSERVSASKSHLWRKKISEGQIIPQSGLSHLM